jgi:glutaminyl-tRNA synthetase
MSNEETTPAEDTPSKDFIRDIVAADVAAGKNDGKVITRFPPEPNGRLHIGHAKAFLLDFGIAKEFGGHCNLRYDDTNPVKEEQKFVDAQMEDLRWLGCDWGEKELHASDYFDQLYAWALQLINDGKAYVCDLNADQMRDYRGTLTEPGRNSPYRDRSAEENLDLFARMQAGEFADGTRTLRAKIDMASLTLTMRDPVMYRILHTPHHRTGDTWCIYPMYDWAHGQSDAIEGVTHSLCDLGYVNHRPLYNWFIEQLGIFPSRQYEFARFNLTYTMMSKRRLGALVNEGLVNGWDDPRLPTIAALRRRGITPAAIRNFIKEVGVAKRENLFDLALLEYHVREDLNKIAPRVMAVLNPLKVVIENYPENQTDELEAINNPEDQSAGTRMVPFGRELYIERDDFMEDPPKKFFRLGPGREVRLRYAYFITCTDVIKDDQGQIIELRCTYDPATRGGNAPDGRKVRGTIHWVSAADAFSAQVRLYDRLFTVPEPDKEEDFRDHLNPESLTVLNECRLEPHLAAAEPGITYQFERTGYFCVDAKDSTPDNLVFNRTVPLRDSWAKIAKGQKPS